MNSIEIYTSPDGTFTLDVQTDAETVWLSQQQIAELFHSSRTNIVEHIRHIYDEQELEESATCRNFRQVQTEGTRQVSRELPFYNLDMIVSVGYRVKSKLATQFRVWATDVLRRYMLEGAALNEHRLAEIGKIVTVLARSSDELIAELRPRQRMPHQASRSASTFRSAATQSCVTSKERSTALRTYAHR